jgi:hypothetical protein
MALSAKIQMRVAARQLGGHPISPQSFAPVVAATLDLAEGTGANQADRVFAGLRTLASDASDDIDLRGALLDAFGAALDLTEIVAIGIVNANADGVPNTTALTVGGGSNPFDGIFGTAGDRVVIPPGGFFLIAGGGAAGLGSAAAGSSDILRIANGAGASATYQIIIIARSS